jgi:glutaredoxin 3
MALLFFLPSCVAATALSTHTDEYTVVDIDLMQWEVMDQIQTQMLALTGARSVPRVFIGHKFFGDSSATVAASKSGALASALRAAGVHVK